jgi:hypothetical protein
MARRRVANGGKTGEGGEEVKREVPFSNLKKVYWPKDGYTKGDLIDYYRLSPHPFFRTFGIDRSSSRAIPTVSRASHSSRRMRPTSCRNGCAR